MSGFATVLLASAWFTQGQEAPVPLEVGKVVREQLEFGAPFTRTISAQAGDRVEGVAMQLIGDLRITIRNPQGETLPVFDYAPDEYEPFRFRAASTGEYSLIFESVADRLVEFDLYLALVEPEAPTRQGRAQQYLRTVFPNQPGIALVELGGGTVQFAQAVGSDGQEQALSMRSVFPVEEWELPLARFAVIHLVESGRLDPQLPIADAARMPELDHSARVEHLLQRTSGLRCTYALEQLRRRGEFPRVRTAQSNALLPRQRELNFVPGRDKDNLAAHSEAQILARVCETVVGDSYANWMQDELLPSLGLHDTTFSISEPGAHSVATKFSFARGAWHGSSFVHQASFPLLPRTSLRDLASWYCILHSEDPRAMRWRGLYGELRDAWTHTQVGIPTEWKFLRGKGKRFALIRNLNHSRSAPKSEQTLALLDGAAWKLDHPGRRSLRSGRGSGTTGCHVLDYETPVSGSFYSHELDLTVSINTSFVGPALRHPEGPAYRLHPSDWPDRARISWKHIRSLDFRFDEQGVAQSFRASGEVVQGLLFERVED